MSEPPKLEEQQERWRAEKAAFELASAVFRKRYMDLVRETGFAMGHCGCCAPWPWVVELEATHDNDLTRQRADIEKGLID